MAKRTLTLGQLSTLSGSLLVITNYLNYPSKDTRENLEGLVKVASKFIKAQYKLKGRS